MRKLIKQKFLLLVCFISFSTAAIFAQQYSKYVVVFKNKNNSPYSLNNPIKYLSQRAISRRQRYNINIDSSDLPVNPFYIRQVVAQGAVSYLSQSKWLNQILINTTSTAAVNAIKNLPFVKSVNPVGPASTTLKSAKNKFTEKVEKIDESLSLAEKTEANYYHYGSSFAQVSIHKGQFLHNKGFTGKGIIISVIDAGFYKYKTTKAFDSARAHNQFLGERDFVDLYL